VRPAPISKEETVTTIKDIAREAGVSVSTVSRVLAKHPDVSARTERAVQEVIDRYHFAINRNARNLKQSETTTILVMVKGRYNMLFASMLEYIQDAVTKTGFTTVIQFLDEDDDEVEEAERLVPEIKPKGVVFLGGDPDHMETSTRRIGHDCPAVVLTNTVTPVGQLTISSVTTDDRQSAARAIDYLVSKGHRRIGVIGGDPANSTISAHRRQGVIEAMSAHQVEFDANSHYVGARFSLACGYDAVGTLLDSYPELTAIYAMSDIMALGAIRGLYDRGLTVPKDVSVIGHDGIALAAYIVPKLVTIRQPQEEMVDQGIAILMNHIKGDPTPVEQLVPADIIDGESVRALGD
jgi:LacI family transcriptional regulator